MRLVAIVLSLLAFSARADVAVSVTANADWLRVTITGDAVPVTITLAGGVQFDQFLAPGVQPAIGGNNDDATNPTARSASVTVTGPLTADAEVDYGVNTFPEGSSITAGGSTSPFSLNGSTWTATVVTSVSSQTVTANWINATCYEDGSAIPPWDSDLPGRLVSTTVEYGLTQTDGSFSYRGEITAAMPATSVSFAPVVSNEFRLRGYHTTAEGVRSDYTLPVALNGTPTSSDPVCVWTAPEPTPEPTPEPVPEPTPEPVPVGPSVFPVVSGLNMSPAYGITATGKRSSTVVAFVPVGTPCVGDVVFTYRGRSYRHFDAAAAQWWGTAPRDAAAVACQ